MKSKENIVFLGMMGSGKTSIGSMVSKKLKVDFFDIDKLIEYETDMKISKIFLIKGEKFFRDLEEKITLKSLKKKKCCYIAWRWGFFKQKHKRVSIIE